MKYYTLGEIFRLGLIKDKKGKPYKHKASVTNFFKRSGIQLKVRKTKFGYEKMITGVHLKKLGVL